MVPLHVKGNLNGPVVLVSKEQLVILMQKQKEGTVCTLSCLLQAPGTQPVQSAVSSPSLPLMVPQSSSFVQTSSPLVNVSQVMGPINTSVVDVVDSNKSSKSIRASHRSGIQSSQVPVSSFPLMLNPNPGVTYGTKISANTNLTLTAGRQTGIQSSPVAMSSAMSSFPLVLTPNPGTTSGTHISANTYVTSSGGRKSGMLSSPVAVSSAMSPFPLMLNPYPAVTPGTHISANTNMTSSAGGHPGMQSSPVAVSSSVPSFPLMLNPAGTQVSSFTSWTNVVNVKPSAPVPAKPQISPVKAANKVQSNPTVVGPVLSSGAPRAPAVTIASQSAAVCLPTFGTKRIVPSSVSDSVSKTLVIRPSSMPTPPQAVQRSTISVPSGGIVPRKSQINVIQPVKATNNSKTNKINNIISKKPLIVPKLDENSSKLIFAEEVLVPVLDGRGRVTGYKKNHIPYVNKGGKEEQDFTVVEVACSPQEKGIAKKFILCPKNGSPLSSPQNTTSSTITGLSSCTANSKKSVASSPLPTGTWDSGLRSTRNGEPSSNTNVADMPSLDQSPSAEEDPDVVEVPVVPEDPLCISSDDEENLSTPQPTVVGNPAQSPCVTNLDICPPLKTRVVSGSTVSTFKKKECTKDITKKLEKKPKKDKKSEASKMKKKKKKKKNKTEKSKDAEKKKWKHKKRKSRITKISEKVLAAIRASNPNFSLYTMSSCQSVEPSSSNVDDKPLCNELETVDVQSVSDRVPPSVGQTSLQPHGAELPENSGRGQFLWHHPSTDLPQYVANESEVVVKNELTIEMKLPVEPPMSSSKDKDPLLENNEVNDVKPLTESDVKIIHTETIAEDSNYSSNDTETEMRPLSSSTANENNARDESPSSCRIDAERANSSVSNECITAGPPKQEDAAPCAPVSQKRKLIIRRNEKPIKSFKGPRGDSLPSIQSHQKDEERSIGIKRDVSSVTAVKSNVLRDCIVRKFIHDCYTKQTYPTIESIHQACCDSGLDCSRSSVQSHLNSIGFKWIDYNSQMMLLVEDHKLVAERMKFFKKLNKYKSRTSSVVYIFVSEYVKKNETGWHVSPNDVKGPCLDATRVVLHAMCNKQLLDGGLEVLKLGLFRLRHNDVISWLKCNVMPKIPEGSVIVLGHHPMFDENKESDERPNLHWSKEEIALWLISHGVPKVKLDLAKALLLNKADKVILPKTSVFDILIRRKGFIPLRLPKHHLDLNPIEFIWQEVLSKLYKTPEVQSLDDFDEFANKEFSCSRIESSVVYDLVRSFEHSYQQFDEDFDRLLEQYAVPRSAVPCKSIPAKNTALNDAASADNVALVAGATNAPPATDIGDAAHSQDIAPERTAPVPAPGAPTADTVPADKKKKKLKKAICPVCLQKRTLKGYRCGNCKVFWGTMTNNYKYAHSTGYKLPYCDYNDREAHIKTKGGVCPGCRRYRYELVLYHQCITLKRAPRYVIPIPPLTEMGKLHWSEKHYKRAKKLAKQAQKEDEG